MIKDVKIGYVMVFSKMKVSMNQPTESILEELNKAYQKLVETAQKVWFEGASLGRSFGNE